jgi:hypothetical protein
MNPKSKDSLLDFCQLYRLSNSVSHICLHFDNWCNSISYKMELTCLPGLHGHCQLTILSSVKEHRSCTAECLERANANLTYEWPCQSVGDTKRLGLQLSCLHLLMWLELVDLRFSWLVWQISFLEQAHIDGGYEWHVVLPILPTSVHGSSCRCLAMLVLVFCKWNTRNSSVGLGIFKANVLLVFMSLNPNTHHLQVRWFFLSGKVMCIL